MNDFKTYPVIHFNCLWVWFYCYYYLYIYFNIIILYAA